MKKIAYLLIFLVSFFIIISLNVWAQKKEMAVTQGEIAKLIGEPLGYEEEHIANLKKIGITPLGEWDTEKPLTRDDFDAILIRTTRRSPIVENMEPAKILDSLRFPSRDVSNESVKKVLSSDAFKKATINSKLILLPALLPLPPAYQAVIVAMKDIGVMEAGTGTSLPEIVIAVVPPGDGGNGDEDGDGDGDDGDDGDGPPPDVYLP